MSAHRGAREVWLLMADLVLDNAPGAEISEAVGLNAAYAALATRRLAATH